MLVISNNKKKIIAMLSILENKNIFRELFMHNLCTYT